MQTHNLGYPRIGSKRELKKACEAYWSGNLSAEALEEAAAQLRKDHWLVQKQRGLDLIPCHDFSLYDHMLDMACLLGAVPPQYEVLSDPLERYFAMARGYQKDGIDLPALEMTKWFDTNYHYIVPRLSPEQPFTLHPERLLREVREAKALGIVPKPVLVGPYTFLSLSKSASSTALQHVDALIPLYVALFKLLQAEGVKYIQMDEPILGVHEALDVHPAYEALHREVPEIKVIFTHYFEGYGKAWKQVLDLPVDTLHLDLVRSPYAREALLQYRGEKRFSLGIIDGRNVWKTDATLLFLQPLLTAFGPEKLMLSPSCSLLHVPVDLALEKLEIQPWLAFATQKLEELDFFKRVLSGEDCTAQREENRACMESKKSSARIHRPGISDKVFHLKNQDEVRDEAYPQRSIKQAALLGLGLFPTTTIGSFPQTASLRNLRSAYKAGELPAAAYQETLESLTKEVLKAQEDLGLDVLVHGEFERTDMVEYFGEHLEGFAFTAYGWVQSYGSRCVKPPILFGDVERTAPITVNWSRYAQSQTPKWVKGMLTGPVTILQWSFVRNDQDRKRTCFQLALALREEVADLEKAGIRIIQVDEPGLREGLPLRKENQRTYLDWATAAFRVATSGVKAETQIHTHMCYAEFEEIMPAIVSLDADVITLECSRSQNALLHTFKAHPYPNAVGPGVYDIHSPRVPSVEEMQAVMENALKVLPKERLWVNPDCGLKTRKWPETRAALMNMVEAAHRLRTAYEKRP
jgi:5-methyltetrahydropteroyltriglutamate--homocysteine methyltransferase